MGYVCTLEEYQRIGKTSCGTANKMLHDGLHEHYIHGNIYGAQIHGSVFHTDFEPGSDIDVLVVINSRDAHESKKVEDELHILHDKIMESTCMHVDFIPIPIYLARSGDHTIDYLYAKYMQTFCRDGVIGIDPFNVIAPKDDWQNPVKEVVTRLGHQLCELSKGRTKYKIYGEQYCRNLEKMMRQPIYAAIDVYRLLRNNFMYPSMNGKPLSKAECCELYLKEFYDLAKIVEKDLRAVLGARKNYRDFLKQKGDYIRLLEEIDEIHPNARNVMEINLSYLKKFSSS